MSSRKSTRSPMWRRTCSRSNPAMSRWAPCSSKRAPVACTEHRQRAPTGLKHELIVQRGHGEVHALELGDLQLYLALEHGLHVVEQRGQIHWPVVLFEILDQGPRRVMPACCGKLLLAVREADFHEQRLQVLLL